MARTFDDGFAFAGVSALGPPSSTPTMAGDA